MSWRGSRLGAAVGKTIGTRIWLNAARYSLYGMWLPKSLHTIRPVTVRSSQDSPERRRLDSVPGLAAIMPGQSMAQEYKPGDIVPQSDICTITHDPVHADMPREVTIIKRR